MQSTFGDKVIKYFASVATPQNVPNDIEPLVPHQDAAVRDCVARFYGKFFADNRQRVLVLGVNPGRFGSGQTGIPFTDPVSLADDCGLSSDLPARRELSSTFVYSFIRKWGGPAEFYEQFFLSAACPVGFVKGGKNCNYYDDPALLEAVTPLVLDSLREQVGLGVAKAAIVLGAGRNYSILRKLNERHHLFSELIPLEHPRFILQYRRAHTEDYLRKYADAFQFALASGTRGKSTT